MTVLYTRRPTDRMLTMSAMEVHIWNLLNSEGPMDAAEIVRRTRGDYFDIINAIQNMAKHGDVAAYIPGAD